MNLDFAKTQAEVVSMLGTGPGHSKPPIVGGGKDWTSEENAYIIAQKQLRKSWSEIATGLPGRTHEAVESHWRTKLDRAGEGGPGGSMNIFQSSAAGPKQQAYGKHTSSAIRSKYNPQAKEFARTQIGDGKDVQPSIAMLELRQMEEERKKREREERKKREQGKRTTQKKGKASPGAGAGARATRKPHPRIAHLNPLGPHRGRLGLASNLLVGQEHDDTSFDASNIITDPDPVVLGDEKPARSKPETQKATRPRLQSTSKGTQKAKRPLTPHPRPSLQEVQAKPSRKESSGSPEQMKAKPKLHDHEVAERAGRRARRALARKAEAAGKRVR